MKITLQRCHFATTEDGDSEFDWLLHQLGVKKEKMTDVDEVDIDVESFTTGEGDET